MAPPRILNTDLFEILRSQTGHVNVQGRGQKFLYKIDRGYDGSTSMRRLRSGEEYAVCCPICHEKRYRLNISYMFGTKIPGFGEVSHLAHCWNEECDVRSLVREWLSGTVFHATAEETTVAPTQDEIAAQCAEAIPKLSSVPLEALPKEHPALVYLRERRFEPAFVSRYYGVSYIPSSEYPLADRRLLIPVYHKSTLVGWQTRHIPGHSPQRGAKCIKYWTSPGYMKTEFLYNYASASQLNIVVLVEGTTDVWRIGGAGCAILGRNISTQQAELVAKTWTSPNTPIVLLSDPGFERDWRNNRSAVIEQVRDDRRVILIEPELDAGDSRSDVLWARISAECKARGLAYG